MGILLVYDVTDDKSFGNIGNWIRNIDTHAAPNVSKILIGNKCDLVDKKVIDTERGQALADEYSIDFLECSAKSSTNVDEAFIRLARDIKTRLLDTAAEAPKPGLAGGEPGQAGGGLNVQPGTGGAQQKPSKQPCSC
jgi:Ras-related protein Rab-8A